MGDVEISVCVPMFCQQETIRRCLDSALRQDHPSFEILVVDDGSDDDGPEIARSMLRPGDRLVVNEHNLGAAGNHNRCLELARGRYVQFLPGDDELLPGCLSTLARHMALGVVFTFAPRRLNTDDPRLEKEIGSLHHRFHGLEDVNDGDCLVRRFCAFGAIGNWFGEPTALMIDRSVAVGVGGFREDIHQLTDIDLWVRMATRRRVGFTDEEWSVRHAVGETLSNDYIRSRRGWLDWFTMIWGVILRPTTPRGTRAIMAAWLPIGYLVTFLQIAIPGLPSRAGAVRDVLALPMRESRRIRSRPVMGSRSGDSPSG